ncbi:MAG TPA: TerB family tellurite resistance protein [Candidatus Thermoplasmatota archaeon]|nr:TerB family tellurite resistance protein [Candidatus Thermoplasmatota archaeon]
MPDPAATVHARDALLGVLVGAIHADGKVVPAEVREARLQARGVPALGLTGDEVQARLPEVRATLERVGEVAFLDACVAALPPELMVRAFRAVAEIMPADGSVPPAEERYLARLASAMSLPR